MKNYGLNLELEKQQQSKEDWIFGAVSQPCLASIPIEEREKYLPIGELQNIGEEKMDCASRGPINILETKFTYLLQNKKLKNEKWLRDNSYVVNERVLFSDRFIAIRSGTTVQGNSMKAPIHQCTKGLIPKCIFPQVALFEDYYRGITGQMEALAEEFSKRFTINYEIVYEVHYGEELKDDFLNVAGFAWPEPVNGEYPRSELMPNHVFIAFRLPKYYIYDNYIDFDRDFIKKLSSNYDFLDYGYRIYISSETTPEERKIQLNVFDVLFKNGLLKFFSEWWERFTHI